MVEVEDCTASSAENYLAADYTCFNLSKFNELVEKSPSELLQFITSKRSEFLLLLIKKSTQQNLMSLAIIVLGLACTAETNLRQDLNGLMIAMSSMMDPIVVNFQRWLVSCYKAKKLGKCHIDALFHLTVFLKTFQWALPSSSFDYVSILLPLLTQTCDKCLKGDEELHKTISEQMQEIQVEQKLISELYTSTDIKRKSKKENLHLLEPPENFRSLSILPTTDDIDLPCSFLRPNITKGKYKDAEHYLDVQFRLLREDYIKPLRDGVAEYLSIKRKKQSLKNCKNVRVYSSVSIESETFVDGELMHVLMFQDAYFSQIKWENSKRLIKGNLLCLSSDDFRSILFATVVKRDVKELKKGLLAVMFEKMNDKVFNWKSTVNFVAIEMSSLFESYRHNLSVLQQLDTENFPMKRYIVDVEKTVHRPQYLVSTTTYNMTPLLHPLNEEFKNYIDSNNMYPTDVIRACESVTVADDHKWPTASMLNLDESQYLALKSAITKEFSIIQGPPGTGKTYIGLRTVQLLLYNINNWFRACSGCLPILIVCYTNHALDQFLEGISKFTEKITRIGGRISNEIIAKFEINMLKKTSRKPTSLYHKICEAKSNVYKLKERINIINDYIERSNEDVLSEYVLENNIPLAQYESLKVFKQRVEHCEKIRIYDWLNIRASAESPDEKRTKFREPRKAIVFKMNEEIESGGEADIEFIENQRNVDFYNFDDTCVLKKTSLSDEKSAEWKLQSKDNKRNKIYIKESLQNNPQMESHCASKINNVWSLSISERWQLYKFWLGSFIEEKRLEYVDLQHKLSIAIKQRSDARVEEDLHVLKDVHVVGMTTTGAAKYRHIIDVMNPVVLIVEEAAEILESHVITSLAPKTQHIILIGDQQQLQPSPTVYMLASKYGMNVSLFERMINNGMDYCRLSVQHRMRPEIAALIVPHIYPHLKNHEAVTELEHIKGLSKDVFFVNHDFDEQVVQDSKSKVNDHEARFIVKLCAYFLQQGYKPSQITVLTTYSGQLLTLKTLAIEQGLITKKIQQERSDPVTEATENVRFTVVDNFQGEENDIILISFVRSNNEGEVGFLKVSNRICVALSRAKKGLFCIGNFELLAQRSKLWENVTRTLNQMQSIGQSLCLACQNHPGVFNEVRNVADFSAVPDGGCSRKCEYQMSCGHSCNLFCHPYDKCHENVMCENPCLRFCKNGHWCPKKCFEDCEPCGTLIDRVLTLCGHTVNAPCGKKESKIACLNPCGKSRKEGHPCSKKCWECKDFCETLIDRELSRCGHIVKAPCGENVFNIRCENPCKKTCERGHPCPKLCFEWCGMCLVLVDRVLSRCGHTVNAPCGKFEYEIDCQNPCNETCSENLHPCPKKCFEYCGICPVLVNRVLSRCGHTANVQCGKHDSEINCETLCTKTCSRGHPCTKKCFEPCLCEILVDKTCSKCALPWKVPCYSFSYAKCGNLCNKSCINGHPCQNRCSDICFCDVMIEKTLKYCGHTIKVPCGELESKIKCTSPCKKVLACQHRCGKKCYEPCVAKCEKKTQILLPACGHSVEDECFMKNYLPLLYKKCTEPCKVLLPCGHICKGTCRECKQGTAHTECRETCRKLLPCGHECRNKCSEPCVVKCRQVTNFQSLLCGHSVEAECFMRGDKDELSQRCREQCQKILPCDHRCKGICGGCKQTLGHVKCMETCEKALLCGHKCVKICSEVCVIKCMHMTQIQSPVCEHLLSIECCLTNMLDKLAESCSEPCKEVLPCGHACKGFCSSCYQGRLHVSCQENCERTLICGHKCESKCSMSCPPCAKPCGNWCSHRKCPRTCGSPCDMCTQFCKWHCRHKRCNLLCSEICDREPCNEPCMKKLPCTHSCVGFCGEPCPKRCLVCDSEGLQETCRDLENNNFTGYVCLEDCNHIFKEEDLNRWLTASSDDTREIRLKKCPECRSVIRKNVRFGNIIKICLADVEKIKQATKWDKHICLQIQASLLKVTNNSQYNIKVLYKPIIDVLSSRYPRNAHILTNLESIIKIAEEIESRDTYFTAKSPLVKSLLDFSRSCRERLRLFILNNFLSVSEFQLQQLSRETYRIGVLDFVLKFACQKNLTSFTPEFEESAISLMTNKPFTDDCIKCFETLVENYQKDSENVPPKYNSILKAMNLSGYWYKCSKKHINCISRGTKAVHDVCYTCDKNSAEQQSLFRPSTTSFRIYGASFSNDGAYISELSEASRWNKKDSKSNDVACRGKTLPRGTYFSHRSLLSCPTAASDYSNPSASFFKNIYLSQQPVVLPWRFRTKNSKVERSFGGEVCGDGEHNGYRSTNKKRYSDQRMASESGSYTEYRRGHDPETRAAYSRKEFNIPNQTSNFKGFQEHFQADEDVSKHRIAD